MENKNCILCTNMHDGHLFDNGTQKGNICNTCHKVEKECFTCIYCDNVLEKSQLIENTLSSEMLESYQERLDEDNVCNTCWLQNECDDQRDSKGYVWDNDILELIFDLKIKGRTYE